jgi:8-oxo-dGTP diphosphatase
VQREYPRAPIVGVGAIVIKDRSVLLVRRAHEPNRGQWSIPGGIVELGETLAQAATREVREECLIEVEAGNIVATIDLIQRDEQGRVRYHFVLLDLAADYISGTPVAGTDALEARWVTERELDQLDMIPRLVPVIRKALHQAG